MFVGIDILQSGMVSFSESVSPESLPHGTLTGRVLLISIGIMLTVITQSSAAAVATALAHILFSVAAGVVAFVILPIFVWNVKQTEQSLGSQFGAKILAAFHSGFTLCAALLVLPGVKCFSTFIERLVPERGPILTRNLDASLIEVPEIAIEAVGRTLLKVYADILEAIEQGIHSGIASKPERMDTVLAALRET